MEIYQLKTFVTVAREGTITRASELLFLSQPAVSAHIKAMEGELGLTLFERTARGMSLTSDGAKLLARAEQMIGLHRDFVDEARRIKGRLGGTLRLGSIRSPSARVLGHLLSRMSETCPDVDVALEHGSSAHVLGALRGDQLDVAFFIDAGAAVEDLDVVEVERFGIHLAVPRGWVEDVANPDWPAMARMPWVCASAGSCCGRAAESLFQRFGFHPQKMMNIDQESVTRTLIAGGVGIGFLHSQTAAEAMAGGEVELIADVRDEARLCFATLARRADDPLLRAARTALEDVLRSG